MSRYFCYTTVFSAIELFTGARNARETRAVEDAMAAMKVLGLNPKNAASYGSLFRRHRGRRPMDLLVAGLCCDTGLPLLTARRAAFSGIRGLTILTPGDILEGPGATPGAPIRSRE